MATLKIPVGTQDHARGGEAASVTLVEYGDFQCRHCGAAYPALKRIQEEFGKDLRFVYRNFPIAELHPEASNAASTAEFAATKGKFWEAHDALFENQQRLGLPLYGELLSQLELIPRDLVDVLESGAFGEKLRTDFDGGVRSGVSGTPAFFLNGARFEGTDFAELAIAIGDAIA